MTLFIVIAAVMAAVAAGVVAWPLLRHGAGIARSAAVFVIIAAAAAGLYPLWSNWNWHAPPQEAGPAGPDIAAMVSRLENRLKEQPNDAAGWLMLGRSYLTLERVDEAVVAYTHARALDAQSAEAALGLGEALSLKSGGQITDQANQMFEEALKIAPDNPKALLYGGFAAAARGDAADARARWEALKALHPPEAIVKLLDERIAGLGPEGADGAGTSSSPGGTSASPAALKDATVTVNISLAPKLKGRIGAETPMFVFARVPGAPGPPLAVKRLTTAAIGTQVRLSGADSMVAGRSLTPGQRVDVTVRVSFSGQPLPSQGDLYGELSYDVGQAAAGDLVIDRVQE